MLSQIEKRYNPEYDVPSGPPVTWAEYDLFCAVEKLQGSLANLEARVEALEAENASLKQAAKDAMTLASGESLE